MHAQPTSNKFCTHAQPTSKQFTSMLSIRRNPNPFQNRQSKYAEHTWNKFHRWLSISGYFIAGWAYKETISSLTEHARKCLKVEYLGRITMFKNLMLQAVETIRIRCLKKSIFKNVMLVYLRPVFRIRDILVRIRTRIRDPFQELVYPDPHSVLFVSCKMSPKMNFFLCVLSSFFLKSQTSRN